MTTHGGPLRALTSYEAALLNKLLSVEFPGREALRRQRAGLSASPLDDDGSLRMLAPTSERAGTSSRVPVEGEIEDSDGVVVHVLLHVVDGLMYELEIYREDSGRLKEPIDPAALRVAAQ